MNLMTGGLMNDPVDRQRTVVRVGKGNAPVRIRERGEEGDVQRGHAEKCVERIGPAGLRLAGYPFVLVELLRFVRGRRQRHPHSVTEGKFALRKMDQNLPRIPLAWREAALELIGTPLACYRADSRGRFAHRADRFTVVEVGGI